MGSEVVILREPDVRAALDMRACIDAVESAFAAYSSGNAELPNVIHLNVPEHHGEIHVKAGYLHGGAYYAAKFASGFYDPALPEAAIDGMIAVFDAASGAPAAFLMDHGFISDLRTGAAGGVAARWLAPERVETVAVIGTGAQARYQMDALAVVRPGFEEVRVWGRDPEHARACVEDLLERQGLPKDCRFDAALAVEEAVDGADVVITCTASREPLVLAEWLDPGVHVTALGSDGVGKQELEPDVLRRADLVVADSREQCSRLGELQHVLAAGMVTPQQVVELGEVIARPELGRTSEDQTTVCDLTGVGVQDVAAAIVVMEHAVAEGMGERLAL